MCLFAHFVSVECILFGLTCQSEHVCHKVAAGFHHIHAPCLLSKYSFIERIQMMCVCVLPSAWVGTLSTAELSPGPLMLCATTRKRYLVSGMRFWMVTSMSPGRLVLTTRSLIKHRGNNEYLWGLNTSRIKFNLTFA